VYFGFDKRISNGTFIITETIDYNKREKTEIFPVFLRDKNHHGRRK
jgi:hypothetical protein